MLDESLIRRELAAHYDLAPSETLARDLAHLHAPMARVVPFPDWVIAAPYVAAINRLKAERGAVVLAHNYMTPDIFHGIADVVGDSLQLAIEATRTDADIIVQCGVHFMAETSKILNPAKTVLMPDMEAGCSLAQSITAEGIAQMRARYQGAQVVSYVHTTAEVIAASDICCSASHAAQIVASMPGDTVIMTPDKWLAQNVARQVPQKRIVWRDGACIVHERFTPQDLRDCRQWHPGIRIIAHPECPPDVVAEADFAGSTAHIIDYVGRERPEKAMLV
ncbi:MAG: quinolinate synthase NadA, partial [Paracoccus sp. (in: a-proteobacteria)]|nr:quinolinate synthase NadA [Paracoccus sp. (in: a-proteobacteria)]